MAQQQRNPQSSRLVLGRFQYPEDVDRVIRRTREGVTLPILLMADGRHLRTLLPRLLNAISFKRGWAMAELTREAERVVPLQMDRPPTADEIGDNDPVVLLLEPSVPSR